MKVYVVCDNESNVYDVFAYRVDAENSILEMYPEANQLQQRRTTYVEERDLFTATGIRAQAID